MSKILVLDSSTVGFSVALFENEKLLTSVENRNDRSTAEFLTTAIEQLMQNAQCEMSELVAIAVAKGPGSYTGLRISVSTAKGLAFALNIPLISVGTLEMLCEQIPSNIEATLLCPMIDARRMEVFCAVFEKNTKKIVRNTEAVIVDENSFEELFQNNKILFFGEGAAKCIEFLNHDNASFLNTCIIPNVAYSGTLVFEKFNKNEFENLVYFEPFYLKEYLFKTKKER